jgi:hypothetical protein
MSSYNFRRVFLEVVTTHDLQSAESIGHLIHDIQNPMSMSTQIVQMKVTDRADTLEQMVVLQDYFPVSVESTWFEQQLGTRHTHSRLLGVACEQLGLEADWDTPADPIFDSTAATSTV